MTEELLAIAEDLENFIMPYHVAFLHTKFGHNSEDMYFGNAILASQSNGHKISVLSSQYEEENALDILKVNKDNANLLNSFGWVADTFLGSFQQTMYNLKSILLAFKLIIQPPQPRPNLVILDTHPIALFILSKLGFYKTLYIQHFSELSNTEYFHPSIRMNTDLFTLKALRYADEIIMQTKCLEEIFVNSYPKLNTPITILPNCCDTGYWNANVVDIKRIIPDLPEKFILFAIFGEYKKRSNLKLVLSSLDYVFKEIDPEIKKQIHFVFAGHCSTKSVEENIYYGDLLNKAKCKSYGSNVTFLKQLPTIHKKTLLEACTAVIHPTKHDFFEGPILAAMRMSRPVIAVDCGFAAEVLTHRLTGILLEADALKLAKVITKVSTSPTLDAFLGRMAKNCYDGNYSFEKHMEKLNTLICKVMRPKI